MFYLTLTLEVQNREYKLLFHGFSFLDLLHYFILVVCQRYARDILSMLRMILLGDVIF